ncbi:g3467 [Coccomyxa viridis]|uniref:RING-type E3 ubiquitin transferase n=1 Tax=Coccomyxa viridis TaxID=1274662 RepID=A0ABP1FMW2_9CHLO
MARWRGEAGEASACPPEGCFTLLVRLLQLCGLWKPHRYPGSYAGDPDVPHADNPPQTQQLTGRSPERRSPEGYALLPKGQQQRQEESQGAEDASQDETPKSGRTSPAPQYLKGARRSGKLGPSRNPSVASFISENEDFCSTCLEGYSADNPKIWTQCGHHFHLACIYEWLERKQTCPLCDIPMGFEEIL